jgi:hypothetical protein
VQGAEPEKLAALAIAKLMEREDLTRPQIMVYIAIAICQHAGHQPSLEDVAHMSRTSTVRYQRPTRTILRALEGKGLLKRGKRPDGRLLFELLGPRL